MYLVIGLVTGLVCLFGFVLLVVCLLVFAIACLFDVRIVLGVVLLFVSWYCYGLPICLWLPVAWFLDFVVL